MSEQIYHPLTPSQEAGYKLFMQFYTNPLQSVMLLKGYSGTGKSTLIKTILRDLGNMAGMCKMVCENWVEPEVVLSATTNQAAEALAFSIGYLHEVQTVHKALGIKVVITNYATNEKKLVAYRDPVENCLIFIDESSYIDDELLPLIFSQALKCKFVFIGDPAQLRPVKNPDSMPAFDLNAMTIELTDLVRFESGPMTDIVTNMRTAVLTQRWSKFPLHPGKIERHDRDDFDKLALRLFSHPEQYGQVKILAYTNDRVDRYNRMLSKKILGTSDPQVGQRLMVNESVRLTTSSCNTNEEVIIVDMREHTEYDVKGWYIQLAGKSGEYFLPKNRGSRDVAHQAAVQRDDYRAMKEILDTWIDLRPAFACTVNKSQGSTYDIVLVDLGDICAKARTLDNLARLLYVGISRGRSCVHFTGDLRKP